MIPFIRLCVIKKFHVYLPLKFSGGYENSSQ